MPPSMRRIRLGAVALCGLLLTSACSKDAATHYADGNRFRQERRPAEAVIAYRSALQREPNRADAQLALAETLLEMGDGARGLNELIKASELLPERADLQVRIGSMLLLGRHFDDARARADRALAKAPTNVDALLLRANALAGLSNVDAAIEQVEAAIALEPKAGFYANLGTLQQAAGESSQAETSFRRAVELDPQAVMPRLALANFLWAAARLDMAEAELRRAHALDPKHPQANRALATFLLAANRAKEAEPYLIAWSAADQAAGPKFALASYYAVIDRLGDAERVLDDLARTPSRWARARTRIAALRLQQRKPAEALAIADEVLVKQPAYAAALVTRARALLALKRTDEAQTAVQAALGTEPSQIEARYLLGTILASRGDLAGATAAFQEVLRINPRAAVAQVQLARIELLRGVPAASAQLAMDALANDPGNPEARLMLARAAIAQRQFARAGTELRALSAKYPSAAEIQHQLGLLERAQGRPDAARRAFERALTLDPAARDSLGELVGIEVAAKRFAAARALVEARIAAAPADSSLQVLAARVSLAEGQPADAERRLRDTIVRDRAALDAYGLLAQVYLSQRRLDDARQEFDRLAAQDPTRLGALTMSGMILQVQGRRDEARQRYEQVVQRDRGAAVAANNLAWIYAEGKTNLAAARQLAEAAQIALPNRPEVLDTLGFVYLQQNLPRLALPVLEEAVKRDPGNSGYRHHLGLAYQGVGDKEAARRELGASLAAEPGSAAAPEIKRALEALR